MRIPDIVFNDVSLSYGSVANLDVAQSAFENFLDAIGALIDDGCVTRILRSQICLQDVNIQTLNGLVWSVDEWLSDPMTDRDRRNFALALDTKIPVEMGLKLSEEHEEALMEYEYRAGSAEGPDCYAVGFALHTSDVVASIQTDPVWDAHQLEAYICHSATVQRKISVDHFSRDEHCLMLANLFKSRLFDSVSSSAEFQAVKECIFPYLRFSPDVDEQVLELETYHLLNALAKLAKINETAKIWKENNSLAPNYQFSWSGESTSTMNNQDYRDARVFRTPTGGIAVFEKHLYFSARHRIHFIEDRVARTFIIGYIGDHLPTTKFPH